MGQEEAFEIKLNADTNGSVKAERGPSGLRQNQKQEEITTHVEFSAGHIRIRSGCVKMQMPGL
jgi:hypothetical protein